MLHVARLQTLIRTTRVLALSVLAFVSVLASAPTLAREGFFMDSRLPDPVKEWASRVFMVYHEQKRTPIGTALLVHNDEVALHFITAKNVASTCTGPNVCTIRFGQAWFPKMAKRRFLTPTTLSVIHAQLLEPDSLEWDSGNGGISELAYLRTKSPGRKPKVSIEDLGSLNLRTLPAGKDLSVPHYVLGYPHLSTRPSWKGKAGAEVITLRWSGGESLKIDKNVSALSRISLRSNADSLNGSAGGPVLAANGRLIGVIYSGPASLEFGGFYSYVTPVDYIRQLIGNILLQRDHRDAKARK